MPDPTPVPSISHVERRQLRRPQRAALPAGLVLASLITLVALPILSQRRIDRLRGEVNEYADPARARVAEMQTALALESAARRGYLLTGDQELWQNIQASRARRQAAERELAAQTAELGGEVVAREAELKHRLDSLDAHLRSVFADGVSRNAYVMELGEQQTRFRAALLAADSLGAALGRAARTREEEIRETERWNVAITVALVLLALAAAAVVAHLGQGFQSLALRLDESESRQRGLAEEREGLLRSERDAHAASNARREALERVTVSRARLIRGFTHDVRNPLGAADGYLELLQGGIYGPLAPEQRETVGKVRRSIRVALDLIGQLLDIARAEAGQLELHREPVNVCDTAREVAEEYTAQAAAKGLRLTLDVAPEPPVVETDPGRARQILANLVSNAVKYTPEGGRIAVRVDVRERGPQGADGSDGAEPRTGAWVALDVEDTGIGIPPEKLTTLFHEFTRFAPDAAQGSGIGLAISERLARALGGAITVRSAVGAGSTFTLWLPAERVPARAGR